MAATYDLAKEIFVTRDDIVALLDKHNGGDAFSDAVVGCLVRCKAQGGAAVNTATTLIGMVTGVQGLPSNSQPAGTAQRIDDAISGNGASVAVLPTVGSSTVELVKLSLIVAFSASEKSVVGISDIGGGSATLGEAEHASFVARATRGQQQPQPGWVGLNMSAEFAAAVRRRLGRASGVIAATRATVPLDELVVKLQEQQQQDGGSSDGAGSTALIKRISAERDRYRKLVVDRERELGDSIASISRRVAEASDKANAEVARLQRELAEKSRAAAAKDSEQQQLLAALTTMEASITLHAQRTRQLVEAVAAHAGARGSIHNVDEALAWLAANS